MANLTITEAATLDRDSQGHVIMAPRMPAVAEQAVVIVGAANQSNPFKAQTRYIMVNCDTACCLAFGDPAAGNPVAIVGLHRMGTNETRFYPVSPGHVLSVIASP